MSQLSLICLLFKLGSTVDFFLLLEYFKKLIEFLFYYSISKIYLNYKNLNF